MGRDGGSDIGAQHHAGRLDKGHEARIHKTDQHNGGGTGTLNDAGYDGTNPATHNAVVGDDAQNFAHFVAGHFLQSFGHDFHAEQKEAETAKGLKYNHFHGSKILQLHDIIQTW